MNANKAETIADASSEVQPDADRAGASRGPVIACIEEDFGYDVDDTGPMPNSTEDTALYIADMVGALAAMAREAQLELVAYLLDMAHVEEELQARQSETPVDDD